MKKMFICKVNYTKPFSKVEEVLPQHREYLKIGYNSGNLLASGPRNPKDGGLIIAHFDDKKELLEFAKNDPFCLNDVAEYEIIEFEAVLYAKCLEVFLNMNKK